MHICVHKISEKILSKCDSAKRKNEIVKVLSKSILMNILKEYYGVKSDSIIKNFFGKPMLKNNNKIHFNISHSKDLIVVVVAKQEIGVDVEYIREIQIDNMKSLLTENEKNILQNKGFNNLEKNKFFFQCWTNKESYFKNIGTGIIEKKMKKIGTEKSILNKWIKYEIKNFYHFNTIVYSEYMVSICVRTPEISSYVEFDIEK